MSISLIHQTDTALFRSRWIGYIHSLQKIICEQLTLADGKAGFITDEWIREEGNSGGGKTNTLVNGHIFEKGGVNTSVVFGGVTDNMRKHLSLDGDKWFASGLSLVLHPLNPYVPTVHANWRYFELYDKAGLVIDRWFGGGCDLTPFYLFEEDAVHFHQTLKEAIDPYGLQLYPLYKRQCDEYFINRHRNKEARGIGGIFYDHLRSEDEAGQEKLFRFQQSTGNVFIEAYLPLVQKRKDTLYTGKEIEWQEIRRGRYVEFNLLHDRGTIFGLQTNGRTESILMSLPPRARWQYDHHPETGTEEDRLLQVCLHPVNWI